MSFNVEIEITPQKQSIFLANNFNSNNLLDMLMHMGTNVSILKQACIKNNVSIYLHVDLLQAQVFIF